MTFYGLEIPSPFAGDDRLVQEERTQGSEGLHIRRQRDGGHPAGVGGYERGFLEREERLGGVVPARIQANVPGCTRIGAPRPIHESDAKLRRQLREPLAGLIDFTVSLDELRRPDV